MPYSQRAIREMYNRVLDSLETEFTDIPPDSDGAEAAAGLREQYAIIVEQSSVKSGLSGTAQEGTAQRAVARQNIKDYMTRLGRSAGSLTRKKPGFNQNFPMPYGKNDIELLDDARAVAVKAMEHKADFGRRGFSPEYLQSINGFIEEFDASQDATNAAGTLRGAAVGGKNAAYEAADDFFDTLEDFMRNFYRNRPDKLAAWKIASHIERSAPKTKDEPAENEGSGMKDEG